MRIDPAHIDQIRHARDGRLILIDADAGGVAADLAAIDPGLKVRFAENGRPPFWAVYHESEDGRTTTLVLTAQAHMTASGVWSGLDQRIVARVRYIDGQSRSGYDYAAEIERANREAYEAGRYRFREQVGGTAELAAHALRRDLGVKSRVFVP